MTLTAKRLRALKANVSQNHTAHKTHKKISVVCLKPVPSPLKRHKAQRTGKNIDAHLQQSIYCEGNSLLLSLFNKVSHRIQTSSVSSNYFKVARQMARRLTGIQVVEAEQPPSSSSKDADADRRHTRPPGKTASLVTQCSYFSDTGVIKATEGGKNSHARRYSQ